MLGPIIQQLAQQIGQYLSNPATIHTLKGAAIRYVNTGQAERDYNRWYNSLSPENQERVDRVILWAIKEAMGLAASSLGGPVAGTVVKNAVELAMNELKENDESIRAEIQTKVENQIATASLARMR